MNTDEKTLIAGLRHGPGRGSQLTHAERLEIQMAYLSEPGATQKSLAQQCGRNRETIANALKGPEFEQAKAVVHKALAEQARDVLKQNRVRAAKKWSGEAIDAAAKKGDHKPMRDLLEATGVIERDAKSLTHVEIFVGEIAAYTTRFESGDRIVVRHDHERVPSLYIKSRYNILGCLPEDIEIPADVPIEPEARALLAKRCSTESDSSQFSTHPR